MTVPLYSVIVEHVGHEVDRDEARQMSAWIVSKAHIDAPWGLDEDDVRGLVSA